MFTVNITAHLYLHPDSDTTARLARIESAISAVATTQGTTMATIQDLTQAVTDLSSAVAPLPSAIDALEAAVTALKAQVGTIPPDVQAGIDEAVNSLRSIKDSVQSAVSDATDNTDEASAPANP